MKDASMTEETIVAVFETAAHADAAVRDLEAANVPSSAITRHSSMADDMPSTSTSTGREQGFWSSLFGGEPDHDTAVYDRSLESGSHVVSVKVAEDHVPSVMTILERNNPIDIDERAATYGLNQTTTTTTTQPLGASMTAATAVPVTGDGSTIQLAEESLVVGKRVVNRGGTRIRRFVVETPVEQDVTLHDEKVVVERRPITDGQPVTGADFSDKTIEMTETAEEAVVGKTARVVEEVSLRKEAVDRTETVRDTLRKEEVEIEQIPGTATTTETSGTTLNPHAPKI
jgi:uncharacterized protein (TIGR02271 family)